MAERGIEKSRADWPARPSLMRCAALGRNRQPCFLRCCFKRRFLSPLALFRRSNLESLPPQPKLGKPLLDFNLLDVGSINSPQAHKARPSVPQYQFIAFEQALNLHHFFSSSPHQHTPTDPLDISPYPLHFTAPNPAKCSPEDSASSQGEPPWLLPSPDQLSPLASSRPSHPSRPSDHITKRSWTTMRDRATSAP